MTQANCPASIQFCAMRIGRLNAQGQVPSGLTNSYVTNLVGKLVVKPELEAGVDIAIKDGCGGMPFAYKTRAIPKRFGLELDILTPDPEVHELLLAHSLITSPVNYGQRTVTDGATTTGSAIITSTQAAWSTADVGATVTGTGIAAATTIVSLVSGQPTQAQMSNNATLTGAGVSLTLLRPLPAGLTSGTTIGSYSLPLSVYPPDYGVSLEVWSKCILQGQQAVTLPWYRWGFFQTYWEPADKTLDNAAQPIKFMGFAVENPGFGTGPGRDWLGGATGVSPARAFGWYRDFALPASACGYTPVAGAIT